MPKPDQIPNTPTLSQSTLSVPSQSTSIATQKILHSHQKSTRHSKTKKELSQNQLWTPKISLENEPTSCLAQSLTPFPPSYEITQTKKPTSLDKFSIKEQESLIINDTLYVLLGYEGSYIKFSERYNPHIESESLAGAEYRISKGLHQSLKDLVKCIIKCASYYSSLKKFVDTQSKDDYGLVNYALSSALRGILKDYMLLITQIESNFIIKKNTFTLQTLYLHLLPTINTLKYAYSLAQDIIAKNSGANSFDNFNNIQNESFDDFNKVLDALRANDGDINALNLNLSRTAFSVAKGGQILYLISQKLSTYAGDPGAYTILSYLLKQSSKPYVNILNLWLKHGIIDDPYNEFLIREQSSIKREQLDEYYNDEYWDKRYTLRKNEIPPQLENPIVHNKILLAGKYLNVVRECGKELYNTNNDDINNLNNTNMNINISYEKEYYDSSPPTDYLESIDDPQLYSIINNAYAFANTSLLSMLIVTHKLRERLYALKHYFFLDKAIYLSSFLDVAGHELKKPAKNVSITKLQSLLELVLRHPGSITANDPFKDDIRIELNEVNLTDWLLQVINVSGVDPNQPLDKHAENLLSQSETNSAGQNTDSYSNHENNVDKKATTGIQALQIDFSIPFPVSLVISRNTILRYQLLFRHLVSLKNVEQLLCQTWMTQVKSPGWINIGKKGRNYIRFKNELGTGTGTGNENENENENDKNERKLYFWKLKMADLRSRMLLLIQQLIYYCTYEVIESNWKKLLKSLKNATTVDQLMQDHVDFLDTCMKECMLTNARLLKIQSKLINICRTFTSFVSSATRSLLTMESGKIPFSNSNNDSNTSAQRIAKFQSTFKQIDDGFNHYIRDMMESLNYYAATETAALLSICARLEMCIGANAEEILPGTLYDL